MGDPGRQLMRDSDQPLRLRLIPQVEPDIPHFHEQCRITRAKFFAFDRVDCQQWYSKFVDKTLDSIGKNYCPVFRMFDGEYAFILGDRLFSLPISKLTPKQFLKRIWLKSLGIRHRSGASQYGWETYAAGEYEIARRRLTECVRIIAEKGMLALGLHDRPISTSYLPMLFDWFDNNAIPIYAGNYIHFYFVYAMMHGPDRFQLLEGRDVLVVTSLTEEKKSGIDRGLQKLNVSSIQFLSISPDKAMLDVIDLSLITGEVDVVLVGAGVGSANILVQLEPLQTLCMDVGFALSTLADPELRHVRPFCIPDDDFDSSTISNA